MERKSNERAFLIKERLNVFYWDCILINILISHSLQGLRNFFLTILTGFGERTGTAEDITRRQERGNKDGWK